jgi:acetyl esterase/lipase
MKVKSLLSALIVALSFTALSLTGCPADNTDSGETKTVAAPTASPSGGTYSTAQSVKLSTATEGANIYYTTNGRDPTETSRLYSSQIAINGTTTLKAIAVKDGIKNSAIMTAVYTFNLADTYTVTTIASPSEGGTITRSPDLQNYVAGANVTVTATPNSGYTFSSWAGAPAGVNAASVSITFNINSNVSLTAYFQGDGTTPIVRDRTNVDYAAPTATRRHNRQRYDLSLPSTGEGPFPLLIYVHGGGFTGGNWQLNQNQNVLVTGAKSRGYAVASVGYLLMTGNQRAFPELVEDVLAAVRHLRANAMEYRLDPNRFAISGFSAGAYLSSIVCALSGAADHLYDVTSLGNAGVSHAVQAAATSASLTDFSLLKAQQDSNGGGMLDHNTNPEGYLLGGPTGHLQNDKDKEPMKTYLWMQNPLSHVSAVTPPMYMVHGSSDNLVPWQQSDMLVNKINEFSPGKAVFVKVSGRGHADFDSGSNPTAILNFLDEKLGIQR